MAQLTSFRDASVSSDPVYWVKAFDVSFSFQDDVPGPGVTISYGFKETGTSPSGEPARILTEAEKVNIRDAVAKIAPYANITFIETTAATADVVFAAGPQAVATGVTFGGPTPVEVWAYGDPSTLSNNTYIYKHELMHALGLSHSTSLFQPTSSVVLIPTDQDDGTTLYGNWQVGWKHDYQLFDIAALQYLHGPAPSQHAGNDTYTLNPAAFDPLSAQDKWPLLWDGGGFDTLDYFSFTVPVDISLEPGVLSRINGVTGGILSPGVFAINYRTVIEAAFGGQGNDRLSGSGGDNVLKGGPGYDTLEGGFGTDTAVYTGMRSQYQIIMLSNGSVQVTDARNASPDGTDTLSNVELFQFADLTLNTTDPSILRNDPNLLRAERFFDSATGDHFYTLSIAEASQIRATLPTYHDEGSPWSTPVKGPGTVDVFRFFDTATSTHFLTSSTVERDFIIENTPALHFEGVAFQSYTAADAGTLTLERFFNPVTGLHHFSASAAETANINGGGAGPGWVDEGAGFIVHV